MEEYIVEGEVYAKSMLEEIAAERNISFEQLLQNNPDIQAKTSPTNQSAFVEPGTALNMESNLGSTLSESQEDDTFIERFFGKNEVTDYFGDLYRAIESGVGRGQTVGENFEIFNKGVDATDEDILEMIKLNEKSNMRTSDEMLSHAKISKEAGGGVWGWIKGIVANPSALPIIMLESIATMGSSLFDAKEVVAAGVATGGAGALAGTSGLALAPITSTAGGIAGFMGGVMGAMETGLTFGQLLEEELSNEGKEFSLDNVKTFLADEEKYNRLKRRAVGRGATIAAVETISGGIAGKVGGKIFAGSKNVKPRQFTGVAAGVGIESVGGGTGEVLGRLAADQEMDINEILFEATAGVSTAPINILTAIKSQSSYEILGQKVNREDIENQLKGDDVDVSGVKFNVKNDPSLQKQIDDRLESINIKANLKNTRVTDEADINRMVELEKKKKALQNNDTEAAKMDLADIKSEIKEIAEKYNSTGRKSKATIELEGRNKQIIDNLTSQNVLSTIAFAKSFEGSDILDLKTVTYNNSNDFAKAAEAAGIDADIGFYSDGVIHIDQIAAAKEQMVNVGGHEVLHGILEQYFGDETADLVTKFRKTISSKSDALITERIVKNYKVKDGSLAFDKEYLSQFSDAVAKGEIQYNDSIFNTIGNFIVDYVLKPLGFSNIKFETGRDVYNFMREYSSSIKEGSLSPKIYKALKQRNKLETVTGKKGQGSKALFEEISSLVPKNIETKAQYDAFTRSREGVKVFNSIYTGAISNYIKNRSVSQAESQKVIDGTIERVLKFNPESKRADGSVIGMKGFVERIMSDTRFAKLDAKKALFEEGERTKQEVNVDESEAAERSTVQIADEATPTETTTTEKQGTQINPLGRFTAGKPELKQEYEAAVKDFVENNEMEGLNYKTLKDIAPKVTEKIFNSSPGFITKKQNARALHALLPEGAMKQSYGVTGLKTSTGIVPGILKNFYEKGTRPDMKKGTAAALPTQTKLPFDEKKWNEIFTKKPSLRRETFNRRVDGLKAEIGRAITNSEVRKIVEPKVAVVLADGKSTALASKSIETVTGNGLAELNETYENGKFNKGDIRLKRKMLPLTKLVAAKLENQEKELIVYALTGTGKDKTNPNIGGRYALYPSTSTTRKALGFKRSDLNKDQLNTLKNTRRYGGIMNITSKSKFDQYVKLFNNVKNNDNSAIQKILLENETKKQTFLSIGAKLTTLALENPNLKDYVYHIINIQDNYTNHFLRTLHPLISLVNPKGLKAGDIHDEHFSRSKRTAHYLIGIIGNYSKRKTKPSAETINKDLNNLWKGMYRGIISKNEAKNFSSTYDYGTQVKIDESPLAEMKEKLNGENHIMIPNTIINNTENIVSLNSDSKGLASKSINTAKEFAGILEETKGIAMEDVPSFIASKQRGKKKDKFRPFVPYSAEDFEGLMYPLYGKGTVGDTNASWFKEKFYTPLSEGLMAFDGAKQKALQNWTTVKKSIKASGINLSAESLVPGYTKEQALRVRMWLKKGYDIPGLNKKEAKILSDSVRQDFDSMQLMEKLDNIFQEKIYPEPKDNDWLAGGMLTDILEHVNNTTRKEYLAPFFENVEQAFGKFGKGGKLQGDNLNKLRAAMGQNYIDALENILTRIRSGRNRPTGPDKVTNNFLDWVNNSVGTIMFFNTRSALLQTISSFNFINWSDNNIVAAASAFSNQKQFWADFTFLYNSDFLKARRSGLKTDINADEIASATEKSSNKVKAALAAILKKGFLPTQIADSFAISIGGASFYRNRLNKYLAEGMSQAEAKEQTFLDFQELSESAQQSSRPDRISMQQASPLGRIILAFQNTPMQYTRLMKKSVLDLINNRGDWKSNVSKIVYYGAVQNLIFHALQTALFALAFDDEEDEEKNERYFNIGNRMADTLLIGTGVYGAIAATTKNVILEVIEQEKGRKDFTQAAIKTTALSPPINSKLQKMIRAGRRFTYKQEREKMKELGIDTRNPAVISGGEVLSAVFNLPADRAIRKWNNLVLAANSETELWQSIALSLGYSEWDVKLGPNQKEPKMNARIKIPREKIKREKIKREPIKRN
jgi:hypothetical protein